MKRADLTEFLAPPAPPCYPSRTVWIQWLRSTAEAKPGSNGPIKAERGEAPAFNFRLAFCADCSVAHRSQMLKEGKCDPRHLHKLAPQEATA